MARMKYETKELIETQKSLLSLLGNKSDDYVVEFLVRLNKLQQSELLRRIGKFRIDNVGNDAYELAERIEDGIYKIRFGPFAKIILPGMYVEDRRLALRLRSIVAG